MSRCTICRLPVHEDEAHYPHERDRCRLGEVGHCACDIGPTHAECCDSCQQVDSVTP